MQRGLLVTAGLVVFIIAGKIYIGDGEDSYAATPPHGHGHGPVFADNSFAPDAGPSDSGYLNDASITFDGTNERLLSASDDESLECDTENKLTVTAWIKPVTNASNKGIVAKFGGSQNTFSFQTTNTTGIQARISSGLTDSSNYGQDTGSVLATGNWYFVAMVYDGAGAANADRLKIYTVQDGSALSGARTLSFVGTIPATLTNGTAKLSVAEGAGGGYYNAKITNVSMWCAALSLANLQAVYNSGNPPDLTGNSYGEWRVWLWMGDDNDSNTIVYNRATGATINFDGNNLEAGDITTDHP